MGSIELYKSLEGNFLPDFKGVSTDEGKVLYSMLLKWLRANSFIRVGKSDYAMIHHYRGRIHCTLYDGGEVHFVASMDKFKQAFILTIDDLENMSKDYGHYSENHTRAYDFLKGILRDLAAEVFKKTLFNGK